MIPRLKADLGMAELLALLPRGHGRKAEVASFERAFAAEMGQAEAVAFPYGRTALIGLLQALGLQGREIVCPAYSCVVVPHAIVTSGNEPVFVDVEAGGVNMDLALAAEAVGASTGAVIPTSIFGHPVDLDALDRLRADHPEPAILQDCAHSFAASWCGRPVHKAGQAAFFGMNISKLITSIFGGMATTDDPAFAVELRAVRDNSLSAPGARKALARAAYLVTVEIAFCRPVYGLVNRLERSGLLSCFVDYYDADVIDMPADYRIAMTGLEARVGREQVAKYARVIAHRRALARIYDRYLAGLPGLARPPLDPGATFSHYVVTSDYAETLKAESRAVGIQLGELLDYHIPDIPAYRGYRRLGPGRAAALPSRVVNLPVHRGMSEREAERLCQVIRSVHGAVDR